MECSGQTCFETIYPRVLGGTSAQTTFHSVDYDSDDNLVIGGDTSDLGLAAALTNAPAPFILNIQRGNFYRWGVVIGGADYDRVNAIKYNPAGDKVFASMDT